MVRLPLVVALILALIVPSCLAADLPDAPSQVKQDELRQRASSFAKYDKNANVLMKDGSRVSGMVITASENSFELRDSKTNQTRTLNYEDVQQIKRKGLPTAAWIAIVAGAIGGGAAIIMAAAGTH